MAFCYLKELYFLNTEINLGLMFNNIQNSLEKPT